MVGTTDKNNNKNTNNINKKLNPYFVTGYADGESSFSIRFRKSADANRELLENIKEFFDGVGWISTSGNMCTYEVTSFKSLQIVRKHFENYPLETSKSIHFLLWCEVLDLIQKKVHFTHEGFLRILSIKAVFPKGLSGKLTELYPDVIPIKKPEFVPSTNPWNPHWVAGFVQADGSFGLNVTKQPRMKLD